MGIPISRVGPAIIMFVACKEHPPDVPGKTAVPKHTDYCHDGIDFLHALLYHGGVVAKKLRLVVDDEASVLQETQTAICGDNAAFIVEITGNANDLHGTLCQVVCFFRIQRRYLPPDLAISNEGHNQSGSELGAWPPSRVPHGRPVTTTRCR
jgi:hypothetical protein